MRAELNSEPEIQKNLDSLLFYSDFIYYPKGDKDKLRKKLKKMIKKIDKGEIGDLIDQEKADEYEC